MNPKETLDNYFETRLSELKKYFFRFCTQQEKEFFPELASELYLHAVLNLEKLNNILLKGEFHFYAIRFIYNQRNWNKTKFKALMHPQETNSELLKNLEIPQENEFESEEQYCLEEIEFQKTKAIRSNKLKLAYNDFELHEKILFKKYFENKESLRAIGAELGLSYTSIWHMVNILKKKIVSQEI
jgi:hypothetical protein